MQGFPVTINTRQDVDNLLADPDLHDATVAYLQLLMDERYAYDAAGSWGVVELSGLTRLGLSAAEAVAMGVVDRVVVAPVRVGPTLEEAIAAKSAAIQAEKCRARDSGFDVTGTHFDSDPAARLAYGELADVLRDDPAYTTPWRASEGVWVSMDAALYAKVKAAGTAHVGACFAWQGAKDAELASIKAAVAAGTMTKEEAQTAAAAVSAVYTAA